MSRSVLSFYTPNSVQVNPNDHVSFTISSLEYGGWVICAHFTIDGRHFYEEDDFIFDEPNDASYLANIYEIFNREILKHTHSKAELLNGLLEGDFQYLLYIIHDAFFKRNSEKILTSNSLLLA